MVSGFSLGFLRITCVSPVLKHLAERPALAAGKIAPEQRHDARSITSAMSETLLRAPGADPRGLVRTADLHSRFSALASRTRRCAAVARRWTRAPGLGQSILPTHVMRHETTDEAI